MSKSPILWAFDTEDDSKGNVKIINFFDGETHTTFHHADIKKPRISKRERTRLLQKRALEFLTEIENPRNVFWSVNLGYDLNNLFGEHLYLPAMSYVGSRIISAKIPGTGFQFFDTLNHWKMSVKAMGERIGLPKLDAGNDFDNIEYCQRDTEICWKFVNSMKGTYEQIDCKLKSTIGSTSLRFFESNFSDGRFERVFTREEMDFLKRGYYGGRTEIFFNKPVEGRIFYFDFNSLYPAVSCERFPVLRRERAKFTDQLDLTMEGAAEVTFRAPDLEIPYLPMRDEESHALLFPVGKISGVYTYFEIREALKLGYQILKIGKCFELSAGSYYPFRDYMIDLFGKRQKARESKDEMLTDGFKNLMNNLYGKWAQGNEFEELVPHEGNVREGDVIFGPLKYRKTVGQYPEHSNMIWGMYTTAYGRHKLYGAMREAVAKGALLLYCDTDSLIFENETPIFKDSKELGELKSEGIFKYAHFKLPKLYHLTPVTGRDFYKAKGIPKKQRINGKDVDLQKIFFETGSVKFRKPLKLRETLRRNLSPKRKVKLKPNYWLETEKFSNKVYDKRTVLKTGHTQPLKME